jgi:ABC-type antimicrobial peptide transport system permease subunit
MYIFINIKNFAKNNTLMFVLLIVMEFFATAIVLFSYGVYNNFKFEQSAQFVEASDIKITFSDNITLGEIKKVMNDVSRDILCESSEICLNSTYFADGSGDFERCLIEDIRSCVHDGVYDITIPEENIADIYIDMKYNPETDLYEYEPEAYEIYSKHTSEGEFLPYDDYSKGEKYLMYCRGEEGNNMQYAIGSTVTVCGEEYKVLGRYSTLHDVQPNRLDISYYAAPDSMQIDSLSYYFEGFVPKKTFNEVTSLFKIEFGDNVTTNDPDDFLVDEHSYYSTVMLISLMFILVSAINFALLFRYILGVRNRSISIFRIEGCRRIKAVKMFAGEFALISLICFSVSTLVYNFAALPKLKNLFEYMDYIYSWKTYLIIFVMYMLVIMLTVIVMILRFIKKTPLNQIKGAKK